MCELFAMSSSVPATVNMSLEEFSQHGGLAGPHKDGWGIAYYEGKDVRLIRDTSPASTSQWVRFIEDCSITSTIVVSHIRKATSGNIALENTQPFVRELGGRMHVFAHNGHMPGIMTDNKFSLGWHRPVGTTDSEYGFCDLLKRLEPLWHAGDPPTREERQRVVNGFANDIRACGLANFIYSDGELTFAHSHKRHQPDGIIRPPGLHVLRRQCSVPAGTFSAEGLRVEMERPTVAVENMQVALIASVPLTREAWSPVDKGEVVVAAGGGTTVGH